MLQFRWFQVQSPLLHLKPTKFEHIFVAAITFFPFFCANTFDTSLLLIVCALKWYVKSLYRHLFLEDISKHARVTQKWHFLICGKLYTQAPWTRRAKVGVWVAKGAISVIPPLLTVIALGGGGLTGKKSYSMISHLRALATHTPSLARLGQGAWV